MRSPAHRLDPLVRMNGWKKVLIEVLTEREIQLSCAAHLDGNGEGGTKKDSVEVLTESKSAV